MEFTFHLIEEITNKFSDKQKIGEGGYGKVYKVCSISSTFWFSILQ